MAQYDVLIEGGRYFDGTGAPSSIRNLAIKDGRVARVTEEAIDHAQADRVINAYRQVGDAGIPGYPHPLRC